MELSQKINLPNPIYSKLDKLYTTQTDREVINCI